ncbi:MAG: heparinase II/III domain-containing protein, partial [Puniceicoccales bacterium]
FPPRLSSDLWEFFSNATESHSTLLINGENQSFEPQARGTIDQFASTPDFMWTSVDLSEAYATRPEARRSILHVRDDYFLLFDSINSPEPITVDWLAQTAASAQVDAGTINLTGRAGRLKINSIYPNGTDFTLREPTSPEIDKKNNAQRTYTAVQRGDSVKYAFLLQPVFGGGAGPTLTTQCGPSGESGWTATVTHPNWTDEILVQTDGTPQTFVCEDAAPVHFNADVAVARFEKGELSRLFAYNGNAIESEIIKLESSTPVSFELSRHESGWILDLITPLDGRLEAASGLLVYSAKGELVPVSPRLELPAGQYFLAASKSDAQSLMAVPGQQMRTRETPTFDIAPTKGLPPASASVKINWEAELDIVNQNSNALPAEKVAASGGMALKSFGSRDYSESLTWEVDVPEEGTYYLAMRYCSMKSPTVTLLIDGLAPSEKAQSIPLANTGGWANSSDDWRDYTFSDEDGNPLAIELTQGKHSIELTAPSASINIDSFTLVGAAPESN